MATIFGHNDEFIVTPVGAMRLANVGVQCLSTSPDKRQQVTFKSSAIPEWRFCYTRFLPQLAANADNGRTMQQLSELLFSCVHCSHRALDVPGCRFCQQRIACAQESDTTGLDVAPVGGDESSGVVPDFDRVPNRLWSKWCITPRLDNKDWEVQIDPPKEGGAYDRDSSRPELSPRSQPEMCMYVVFKNAPDTKWLVQVLPGNTSDRQIILFLLETICRTGMEGSCARAFSVFCTYNHASDKLPFLYTQKVRDAVATGARGAVGANGEVFEPQVAPDIAAADNHRRSTQSGAAAASRDDDDDDDDD